MKRCFVISPIGSDDSAVREHANDVFDYIIAPAMRECSIEPFRSDHLTEPGRISEQMFGAILKDDLLIAVLTFFNPNVFYELAIAQAAARPVIILLEKGNKLPFDIQDLRCVWYDLKPRPLFDKVYVKEMVGHIRSLEQSGWKGSPLLPGLTPLGGVPGDFEHFKVFPRSKAFGGDDEWLTILESADQVFECMGFHLDRWRKNKGFRELLLKKAAAGCKVRLLLMHPDNPVLKQTINDSLLDGVRDTFGTIVQTIGMMMLFFGRLREINPNIEVRQMRRGCPHCTLTRSDKYALAVQYFFSERLGYSPLFQCTPASPLYGTLTQEFEALWQVNAPAASGQNGPPALDRPAARSPRRAKSKG